MKKILKKLFGRQTVDNTRALVNVLTKDGKEHYRWVPLPFTIELLQAIPAFETGSLSALNAVEIDHIDFLMQNKHNNVNENIYAVYTDKDNFQERRVHSVQPLDVLCTEMKPIFSNDQSVLTNVTGIRRLKEPATFCYKGKLFNLLRNREGKLKINKF